MVDRLLRVHIQSQRAFGPWWTLSYNSPFGMFIRAGGMQGASEFVLRLEASRTLHSCIDPARI